MLSSKRLSRLESSQQEIRRQLDLIVTALIVTEPRTAVAAEAFDGLRRNVAFAAQERRRQLTQLVAFADAIERDATIDTLRELAEQWCAEAGVTRYHDPVAQPDWFQVIDGEGTELEAIEPAWVDAANNVLLRPGTARRRPAPAGGASGPEPPPEPPPAPVEPVSPEPVAAAPPPAPVEPPPAPVEPPPVVPEPVVPEPAAPEPADAASGPEPSARPEDAR